MIKIELTKKEHTLITAILLMHHTGMIAQIHEDNRPLLEKIAKDFGLRDMRNSINK